MTFTIHWLPLINIVEINRMAECNLRFSIISLSSSDRLIMAWKELYCNHRGNHCIHHYSDCKVKFKNTANITISTSQRVLEHS